MDKHHSRIIEVHGAHGEEIGRSTTFQAVRREEARVFRSVAPRSLLIIGAGQGDELEDICRFAGLNLSGLSVLACDLNHNRLSFFKERFPGAHLYCGDVLSRQFDLALSEFGKVDLVQMSFVLHDLKERERECLLSRLHLALHPGGWIVTADPTLQDYPNYLPLIPDENALKKVEQGLQRYFLTYIEEISCWSWLPPERKSALLESLDKGLTDALEHQDGREAFDTVAIYQERFSRVGFVDIQVREAHNSVVVLSARKVE